MLTFISYEANVYNPQPPESTKAIPWVVPLPFAGIPAHVASSLSYGTKDDQVVAIRATSLPQVFDSKTYGRHFKTLIWAEEYQMESVINFVSHLTN